MIYLSIYSYKLKKNKTEKIIIIYTKINLKKLKENNVIT